MSTHNIFLWRNKKKKTNTFFWVGKSDLSELMLKEPLVFLYSSGKYVKQIMPANDEGFAFGEKTGRFGRKKKGYYPVANVIPAD